MEILLVGMLFAWVLAVGLALGTVKQKPAKSGRGKTLKSPPVCSPVPQRGDLRQAVANYEPPPKHRLYDLNLDILSRDWSNLCASGGRCKVAKPDHSVALECVEWRAHILHLDGRYALYIILLVEPKGFWCFAQDGTSLLRASREASLPHTISWLFDWRPSASVAVADLERVWFNYD